MKDHAFKDWDLMCIDPDDPGDLTAFDEHSGLQLQVIGDDVLALHEVEHFSPIPLDLLAHILRRKGYTVLTPTKKVWN